MNAFRNTIRVRRPGNRPTAMAAPSGNPRSAAIPTAERLTLRLSRTISTSLGSNSASKRKAVPRASGTNGPASGVRRADLHARNDRGDRDLFKYAIHYIARSKSEADAYSLKYA